MRNIQSDGIAEDLIRSFVQMGCAEVHGKTILEKTLAELETIIDPEDMDAVMKATEKVNQITEEINTYAEVRRSIMLRLFHMFDGDKDYWCEAKHLGIAAYTAFEAYQASEDDAELLNIAIDANRCFVRAMTHFLGVEITDCAACFADALKGDSNGTEHLQ